MADIVHDFPVAAPADRVFAAISTPEGLDQWWTLSSAGGGGMDHEFALGFGPGFDWRARVTRWVPGRELELELVEAIPDWVGTRVGFELLPAEAGATQVRFRHTGWRESSEHFRTSAFCWAMYLRLLKKALEAGTVVPYAQRLEA